MVLKFQLSHAFGMQFHETVPESFFASFVLFCGHVFAEILISHKKTQKSQKQKLLTPLTCPEKQVPGVSQFLSVLWRFPFNQNAQKNGDTILNRVAVRNCSKRLWRRSWRNYLVAFSLPSVSQPAIAASGASTKISTRRFWLRFFSSVFGTTG